MNQHWYLFGGSGFIGKHLARSVLEKHPQAFIHLLDIQEPEKLPTQVSKALDSRRAEFTKCDVREPISLERPPGENDVIINLAAVHREPGHREDEYYETNLKGARNICALATSGGCQDIIFTSSISVYGSQSFEVDEDSQTIPITPYGKSKHQAEEIHREWAVTQGGKLSIIRPGVVFGPGEYGNVTRLVHESIKRKRAIHVTPNLPKAGIYIEELLSLIHWLRSQRQYGKIQTINGVSGDLIRFNDFGDFLQKRFGYSKSALSVNTGILNSLLTLATPFKALFPATSRIHPERLAKLSRPNDIRSARLAEWNYPFAWTLEKALDDWLERGL